MYFLEQLCPATKRIKDAAGLENSSCVMPLNTYEWRQIAVCESREPLQERIEMCPTKARGRYRIISNERVMVQQELEMAKRGVER